MTVDTNSNPAVIIDASEALGYLWQITQPALASSIP